LSTRKALVSAEVQAVERECRTALIVGSVSQTVPYVGRIEKNIRARSTTDPMRLFAHHDPLACSE